MGYYLADIKMPNIILVVHLGSVSGCLSLGKTRFFVCVKLFVKKLQISYPYRGLGLNDPGC